MHLGLANFLCSRRLGRGPKFQVSPCSRGLCGLIGGTLNPLMANATILHRIAPSQHETTTVSQVCKLHVEVIASCSFFPWTICGLLRDRLHTMHGRQKSLIYEWACSPHLSFFFIHTSHFPSLYLFFFFFWIDSSLSFLWAGSLFSFHQTLPISLPFSVRTPPKSFSRFNNYLSFTNYTSVASQS